MDYLQYQQQNTPPAPLEQGSVLCLNDTELQFPKNLPSHLIESSAQVIAILSEMPLDAIPLDYRRDIAPDLKALGLVAEERPRPGTGTRNGLPPDIFHPRPQTIMASATYLIRKKRK